jgi:hypothetical protein
MKISSDNITFNITEPHQGQCSEQDKQRVTVLRGELTRHNHAYYVLSQPLVDDGVG